MFTRCSHCHAAFRVTAAHLRHAGGLVRCGACGRTFNALESLAEGAPPPSPPDAPARDDDAEAPRATGHDETGAPSPPPLPDPAPAEPAHEADDGTPAAPEPRYDDDTGIDEVTWEALQAEHERAKAGEREPEDDARDEAEAADPGEIDALEDELAEEVAALIRTGEFEDAAEAPLLTQEADETPVARVGEDEDTQRHDWDPVALAELEAVYDEAVAADDTQGDDAAVADTPETGAAAEPRSTEGEMASGPEPAPGAEPIREPEPEPQPEPEQEPADKRGHDIERGPESEPGPVPGAGAEPEADPALERAINEATAPVAVDDAPEAADDAGRSRRWPWSIAAVLLCLALAIQLVHYQRGVLATHPSLGDWLVEGYDRLGMVVYPAWPLEHYSLRAGGDVRVGSDDRLDLEAEIGNVGDVPLALPLLRLTLLDRWGAPLAQRVLVPADYTTRHTHDLLAPRETLNANFSVRATADDVFGYRLAVCRRADANRVLCDDSR